MMLWSILTVMACAAAVIVAIPLVRRYEMGRAAVDADTAFYTNQLAEIERDRTTGDISEDQAMLARLEVQRRLLSAAKAGTPGTGISHQWRLVAIAAVTAFIALASVNIYALYGSPGLGQDMIAANSAKAALRQATGGGAASVDSKIAALAARLEATPDDAEGWRMLGWSYFSTGRYDESAKAYAKAMALVPADRSYQSAYAEALVQGATGIVTPEARKIFTAVLADDPMDERSRFYIALATEQSGNSSEALDLWLALLADAPANAGWVVDVRSHIKTLGETTGRDVTAVIATVPVAPADQTSAVAGLPEGDQQAMIAGMVEGLAQRLEAEPHDAEGWKRLIRSRTVLSQPDLARVALRKAMAEFAGDDPVLQDIAGLARELGVDAE